jgi:hypothetical protein
MGSALQMRTSGYLHCAKVVGQSIDSAQLIGGYNHFCTELKISQLEYGCTGENKTNNGGDLIIRIRSFRSYINLDSKCIIRWIFQIV